MRQCAQMPAEAPLNLSLGATLPGESTLLPLLAAAERSLKGTSLLVAAVSDEGRPAGTGGQTAIESVPRVASFTGGQELCRESVEALANSVIETSLTGSSTFLLGTAATSLVQVGGSSSSSSLGGSGSLHVGLVRDTLEDALVFVGAEDQPMTVRLDSLELSGDVAPAASFSPVAVGECVDIGTRRPVPLTEEFYDEDSEEERDRKNVQSIPLASSFSSIGLLTNTSVLGASIAQSHDSLGYTCSNASSSGAGSTMRSTMLGTSGAGSLGDSHDMDTAAALRAALDTVEVRTPTPPHLFRAPAEQEVELPSLPPLYCDQAEPPSVLLQRGQLEVFASAVRGAEGLDKDLQKDLLSLLKNLPAQLPR